MYIVMKADKLLHFGEVLNTELVEKLSLFNEKELKMQYFCLHLVKFVTDECRKLIKCTCSYKHCVKVYFKMRVV